VVVATTMMPMATRLGQTLGNDCSGPETTELIHTLIC
jgi:hypothetical protein